MEELISAGECVRRHGSNSSRGSRMGDDRANHTHSCTQRLPQGKLYKHRDEKLTGNE